MLSRYCEQIREDLTVLIKDNAHRTRHLEALTLWAFSDLEISYENFTAVP